MDIKCIWNCWMFGIILLHSGVTGYTKIPQFGKYEKVDLGGALLKVAVEEWAPHVFIIDNPNGSLSVRGPVVNLLHEISVQLNFRYEFLRSVDNTWGAPLANGSWQGMIGMTMRKEVDMALGPFGVTASRAKVVKFTIPIHYDSLRILMKRPKPVPDPWGFLKPYDYFVWISILVSYAATALLSSLSSVKAENETQEMTTQSTKGYFYVLSDMYLRLYSLFFLQNIKWRPKSSSGTFFLFMWLLLIVVMIRSYNSGLTSMLAVRTVPTTIKNLDDLIHKSDLEMIFEANTALTEYLEKASTGIYADIAKNTERTSFRKLYELFQLAPFTDVKENTGAILMEETGLFIIYSEGFSKTETCDFIMAKEKFWPLMYCLIGPIDSPLTDYFNLHIRRLLDFGLYNRWMFNEVSNYSSCAYAPTKFTITEPYNIDGLWGMFSLLVIGLVSSLLVFIAEMILSRTTEQA